MGRVSVAFVRAPGRLGMADAMLTGSRPLSMWSLAVTIYRADLQQYIATDLVATGRYYWTNVYYFSADTPEEFDLGRDQCLQVQSRAFCSDVHSDRILITFAWTGAVVQHGSFTWVPLGVLPASDSPITNCVLMWLYSGGERVGYKRYRVPVPMEGMSGGLLTATFLDYYYSGPGSYIADGQICTYEGAIIDNVSIDPRVHGWQIRHGTKRSERRAV